MKASLCRNGSYFPLQLLPSIRVSGRTMRVFGATGLHERSYKGSQAALSPLNTSRKPFGTTLRTTLCATLGETLGTALSETPSAAFGETSGPTLSPAFGDAFLNSNTLLDLHIPFPSKQFHLLPSPHLVVIGRNHRFVDFPHQLIGAR